MGLSDYGVDFGDMSAAMLMAQRLHPATMQFARLGETTKWFKPREQKWEGKKYLYRAFTKPLTGVRRAGFTSAAQGEFPPARSYQYTELSIILNDLKVFQATAQYNEREHELTLNSRMAVGKLALKLTGEIEDDFGGQLNAAVNQAADAHMALVKAIYDADSTGLTTGGYGTAYIQIKGGSISQFQKGDILQIYDQSDGTTKNATVVVYDVIYGPKGPPVLGVRTADYGPGLICHTCDDDGVAGTTTWDNEAPPAVGDYIARSGEFTQTASSYTNIHGLRDWFDPTVDVYRDNAEATIDREGDGNHWMNPEVFEAGTSGSPADFDMELHFGLVEDTMPYRVKTGRRQRMNSEQGMGMMASLVAIASPKLINEAVREATASRLFTLTLSSTMAAAEKKQLFGDVGFDGIVYHSPTMGHIALQGDPMAEPETINIIDPNSFFFMTWGGNKKGQVEWLKMDSQGSLFRRKSGTNDRPTFYMEGAAHTTCCLQCDQPGVNTRIRYVKSSRW